MNIDRLKRKLVVSFPVGEQEHEYMLDEDGCVIVFNNEFDAMHELLLRGCLQSVSSGVMGKYEFHRPIGVCRRCGGPIFKSGIGGYFGQCFNCDEDFYSFEFEMLGD